MVSTPSEKYEISWDDIWKNKRCLKPPTSHALSSSGPCVEGSDVVPHKAPEDSKGKSEHLGKSWKIHESPGGNLMVPIERTLDFRRNPSTTDQLGNKSPGS